MNSVEDRLHEAAQALRTTLDPQPPALNRVRGVRATTRHRVAVGFGVASIAVIAGVLVVRAGTDDHLMTQQTPLPVPETVPPPTIDGVAGDYVGRLVGDWLERQRSLGTTIELIGVDGTPTYPNPGRVIAQDPPAGTPTASDSTLIRLTIGDPDVDLAGELPTGLSGERPGSGYWKLTARTVNDANTKQVPSIRLMLDRTIGSAHSITIAESDVGRSDNRPLPLFIDYGQPNSLVFGIQLATATGVIVVGPDGTELFPARTATIVVSGQNYLVWIIDQDQPEGAHLKAISSDGTTLGEYPLCVTNSASTNTTNCPAK